MQGSFSVLLHLITVLLLYVFVHIIDIFYYESYIEKESVEYSVFVKFYSKLTTVLCDKEYLPHLVTAELVSPDNVHHLSNMSNRDRAMRILEYISNSLCGDDTQCFYIMLKIMEDHGTFHGKSLAKDITKAIASGEKRITKISSLGSTASTKSDSIGSLSMSDSFMSGSIRSDSAASSTTPGI